MATTYEKIATTTLGSAAANITFSSISSSYTDLRLAVTFFTTSNGNVLLELNNDTSSLYSYTAIRANGSTVVSSRSTANPNALMGFGGSGAAGGIPALSLIDIFSYAGSTFKTILSNTLSDKNGSGITSSLVNLYRSTTAISTVKLLSDAGNFDVGTTATIYGILKA
jgi:hypothetical protein